VLEEELAVEQQANRAYEAYRSRGVMKDGRRFGAPPKPYAPPEQPDGKANVSDPDSKLVHGMRGWVQGYNAQAVCNEQHLILAAEVMTASPDFGHLEPMFNAAQAELAAAGVSEAPEVVLADAGHWHLEQMNRITGKGVPVLIPPDSTRRKDARPGWTGGAYGVHALSARRRPRQSALQATRPAGRADIREHQAQPRLHPLRQTWESRRQDRMAAPYGDPQPAEAPPALHGDRLNPEGTPKTQSQIKDRRRHPAVARGYATASRGSGREGSQPRQSTVLAGDGVTPPGADARALAQSVIGMNKVATERDARAIAAGLPPDDQLLRVLSEVWYRALFGAQA
jgi:hypothetical protein